MKRIAVEEHGSTKEYTDYLYSWQRIASNSDISEVTTVPGPNDKAVSFIGNVLDRDKFKSMLKEYYRLRGGMKRQDYLSSRL